MVVFLPFFAHFLTIKVFYLYFLIVARVCRINGFFLVGNFCKFNCDAYYTLEIYRIDCPVSLSAAGFKFEMFECLVLSRLSTQTIVI